jgi:hypothetical protein
MAYIWARPDYSPQAYNQVGGFGTFAFHGLAVPPQFGAEFPCPLTVGCNPVDAWQWLDPVYWEYRDPIYPLQGSWPPPQPDTDPAGYATWVAQQRTWMPYEIMAYNGVTAGDGCACCVRGVTLPQHQGQILHFSFSSQPDWPFVTVWNGVRIVMQAGKHAYVTNEGTCSQSGPVSPAAWVQKTNNVYPAIPSGWGGMQTLIQSWELDDFGLSAENSPYGYNVYDFEFETMSNPGGGAWDIANVDNYWFNITQTQSSSYGQPDGSTNGSLGVRKVWAAAIVNLGGTPAPSAGSTAHTAVVG